MSTSSTIKWAGRFHRRPLKVAVPGYFISFPEFASNERNMGSKKNVKSKETWEKPLLFLRRCGIIVLQLRRYVLMRGCNCAY